MAEKEQQHRHALKEQELKIAENNYIKEHRITNMGQYAAISFVIIIVALCGWAFYLGHASRATIIATSVIVVGLIEFRRRKT